MKVRASRLPLAMVCPASLQAAEYDLNSDSEPARLGTAVHEMLATKIGSPDVLGQLGDEAFEQLAVKYTLSMDDIRALSLRALRLWREVEQWFKSPELEVSLAKDLGGVELTGHVDVLSYQEQSRTVHVNDHKTGFLDSDHSDQVRAYGLMALDRFPDADRVHTCITRVRDYVTDHATYSRMELAAWSERVVQRLVGEGNTYQPGRHCSFCPRRLTCPAFRDWVRWAWDFLDGIKVVSTAEAMLPENIRKIYDAKAALGRLVDDAQEVLETLAASNNGVLPRDDAFQLQVTSQIRQNVLFRESWPLLSERIPADQWNNVFTVKKTGLQEAIKAQAGRGKKKNAVAEVMHQLEQAGALAEVTVDRLELKKKTEVIAS